ncbi:MAG TPA: transglycosylase SLT domain-containing protein [Candidatus Limnocylindria bacterium]|nr:transglycosylase SLT domain-containing protein [Candidatus Limnocylindria bacterium]
MLGRYRDEVRAWSDPVGRLLFRLHLRPNHLTVMGLAVSLLAAAAFIAGHTQSAGALLIAAGLFDLFDGSLARASGQVTAFGAFLDSVIDRYSDLVVLLGIVVFFARTPHVRGALVAMAGLVGSVMVSYTKARAESIGIECNVGVMERPERMICLIVGALFGLMEPALWVLAVLANVTALQRILHTRRELRRPRALEPTILGALALVCVVAGPAAAAASARALALPEAVAPAVEAYQQGDPAPLARALASPAMLDSPIGDYARLLLSDALARRGDLAGARAAALAVADKYPGSRLAPAALIEAAVLASHAGDDAAAQAALKRLLESYPDAAEGPQALYMLGAVTAARGQPDTAALAYRQLMILAPASAYADGAADRLAALAATGTPTPPLSITQRIDRAERLLRGGVPKIAAEEAERIVSEARDRGIVLRALDVVAEGARRLGQWEAAARAKGLAAARAPAAQKPRLQLDQARLLLRAGQRDKALALFTAVGASASEAEASEALYQQARTLDDLQRDAEAAAVYRSLAVRYPRREVAGAAMWRLGWLAYLRGDVRGAAQQWARLMEAPVGRVYRTAAIYWRARATEQHAGAAPARRLYAQAVAEAPRGYYGMLAADRIKGEPGGEAAVDETNAPAAERPKAAPSARLVFPEDPAAALAEDPGFVRVELLRRIGLIEHAWQELEDVVRRATGDTVRLYGFSSAYIKDERFHMALRIFRRHFAGLAAADDPALPRAFWEMLYPLGWGEDIGEAARRAGLDPFLVAAVVREESSFHPRALSRAGARGLMQLMPATARPLAEVRGLPFRAGDLLDDPGANLEMGTAFLAGLIKDFGDVRLALAAYNAGPGRMRQWWKARRTGDIEAFVEQIPYDETRQYVKRVMLSWREYTRIYATP